MKLLTCLLLNFIILTSCAKKEEEDDAAESSYTAATAGIYQLCQNASDMSMSKKSILYYNSPSIIENVTYFDGADCTSGHEQWNERWLEVFENEGINHSVVLVGLVSTSLSNDDITYSNTNTYCGYSDWALNVTKNVLGKNCEGTTLSYGEQQTVKISKIGSKLQMSANDVTYQYELIDVLNFADNGQTITDGNYILSLGEAAFYFTFSGGTYSVTSYKKASLKYYTESGTYTSGNNEVPTTVTGYTPAGCQSDVGTTYNYKFFQNSFALAMHLDDTTVLMEKTTLTEPEYRATYLRGSAYTSGCFSW